MINDTTYDDLRNILDNKKLDYDKEYLHKLEWNEFTETSDTKMANIKIDIIFK